MAAISVEVSDAVKEFIDREVAAGRFKDGGALVEMLLTRAMWLRDRDHVTGFSNDDKQRIDQMLQESASSFGRGEYAVVRPGEFEELARRLVEQHHQKQAS